MSIYDGGEDFPKSLLTPTRFHAMFSWETHNKHFCSQLQESGKDNIASPDEWELSKYTKNNQL